MERDAGTASGAAERTARNIRSRIALAGRTQRAVARAVGMSDAQWQRRMSGTTEWRVRELGAVARELGVEPGELTG